MSSMIRNVLCITTPVSRAQGHSAVAGAAYRAGENLKARGQGPEGTDRWFRYAGRRDVVRDCFIMAPDGAPDYVTDRAELWNRIEAMETHKKARLGREIQLGFAYELSHDEQRALLTEFVQREIVDRGFVADVAIHNYGRTLPAAGASEEMAQRIRDFAETGLPFLEREDAQQTGAPHVLILRDGAGQATGYKLYQPHAHVRVTPRTVAEGDWSRDKYASRELNKHETAMNWRYDWAHLQNDWLERAGSHVRVRCTSDEEDEFPTVPRKGEGGRDAMHAIEERAHELTDEQRAAHEEAKQVREIDREFREIHNETIRQAYRDRPGGEGWQDREAARLTAWWRNMAQRFDQWRDGFQDKAEEWRRRFAQQSERMKALLGWHQPDTASHALESQADDTYAQIRTAAPEREPPEQEL